MFPHLLDLPWWGYVLFTLVVTQITIACVTLYLHRAMSHGSVTLHPIISHFMRFWLWLTTGMNTREWVAIHRKHHAYADREGDPHSPKFEGIWNMLFLGAVLYHREAKNQQTIEKYGKGCPEDWIQHNLYDRFRNLGVLLMLATDVALFGLGIGVAIWAVQMAWIPFWAAGVINGVGHFLGYANYKVKDNSRNIIPWGFFIGGEELHNNHHGYLTSAKFSARKWEFDIGWLYLRVLSALGLAEIKVVAPPYDTSKG
ncbi:Fatty-acid desaturase [Thiohalorhabdus denitrificans]|uniref:Fatty-acid desaturase n=1 Tax=Thiohalorhabdus denitrificans TaxID=381306 RepID=A0A1G5AFX9_9GAMM|nr:Fatty-acid desaturase [Thiohalorhabdus denitrificans]